jgi:hypothetical protein
MNKMIRNKWACIIITNLLFLFDYIYQEIYGCIYSFILGIVTNVYATGLFALRRQQADRDTVLLDHSAPLLIGRTLHSHSNSSPYFCGC